MKPADEVSVVYRDDDLLVVAKPTGLPTTSPDAQADCLTRRVKEMDPQAPKLHPTSRLDADVTGLVTFARTKRGNEALLQARRDGRYRRLYLGLSIPASIAPRGSWDVPISIDPRDKRRRVPGAGAGQRDARTLYEVVAQGEHLVLLALRPQTGRTHQLRVHAAHAGLPLLGDRLYGGEPRLTLPSGRVLSARRTMLHCARLTLPSPAGQELQLVSPPPNDFQTLWKTAGHPDVNLGDAPIP